VIDWNVREVYSAVDLPIGLVCLGAAELALVSRGRGRGWAGRQPLGCWAPWRQVFISDGRWGW
jgi:hypothetical protein